MAVQVIHPNGVRKNQIVVSLLLQRESWPTYDGSVQVSTFDSDGKIESIIYFKGKTCEKRTMNSDIWRQGYN